VNDVMHQDRIASSMPTRYIFFAVIIVVFAVALFSFDAHQARHDNMTGENRWISKSLTL
jgi:hypothetical protein